MKKIMITTFALFVLGIFLAGCTENPTESGPNPPDFPDQELKGEGIKKFESTAELKTYLEENSQNQAYYSSRSLGLMDDGLVNEAVAMDSAVAPTASKSEAQAAGGASDYSETNVQVQGVDEADIVKNDGKYIYTIVDDEIVIVDACPAENMEIVSKTDIEGYPQNIFVKDNKMVVFASDSEQVYVLQEYDFVPRPRYTQVTHAYVYDITDRSNPKLLQDYNMNGNYFESRLIGDYVYFITKESVYYYYDYVDVPVIREASTKLVQPDIYYFANPEDNYVFHTVASFNIKGDKDSIKAKSFLMGYSNTLYVSQDNMYITYQKNIPYSDYKEERQEQFFEVVVPLLPSDAQSKINEIWNNNEKLPASERWDQIATVLEDTYNNMEEDDKEDLLDDIEDAIAEYQAKKEEERRKTVIHKLGIDNGIITYNSKAEVKGYLLNQFSLDEYQENLRVATTTYIYRGDSTMYNNVYVLDKNMKQIGSLEGLAEDEKIYSTRFIGDRLYMVTFKRMDPLFVISLENPTNPEVLGELKIPGFSDYLHPYDEDHIIGVGKETESNYWGGVSTKGVKIALFDVSDVKNPTQIDMVEIGKSGTDSEVLQDHKAFLFDKEKNLLVIPVREIKGARYRFDSGYYGRKVWQGAYVFGLTPEEGFEEKGKISHFEGEEEDRWYWNSPWAIRRALYMDEVLYTVSAEMIKANSLDDLDNEISSVDLPYNGERYYPIYY